MCMNFFVIQRHPGRYVMNDGSTTSDIRAAIMPFDECATLFQEKRKRVPFLKLILVRVTAWTEEDLTQEFDEAERQAKQ